MLWRNSRITPEPTFAQLCCKILWKAHLSEERKPFFMQDFVIETRRMSFWLNNQQFALSLSCEPLSLKLSSNKNKNKERFSKGRQSFFYPHLKLLWHQRSHSIRPRLIFEDTQIPSTQHHIFYLLNPTFWISNSALRASFLIHSLGFIRIFSIFQIYLHVRLSHFKLIEKPKKISKTKSLNISNQIPSCCISQKRLVMMMGSLWLAHKYIFAAYLSLHLIYTQQTISAGWMNRRRLSETNYGHRQISGAPPFHAIIRFSTLMKWIFL